MWNKFTQRWKAQICCLKYSNIQQLKIRIHQVWNFQLATPFWAEWQHSGHSSNSMAVSRYSSSSQMTAVVAHQKSVFPQKTWPKAVTQHFSQNAPGSGYQRPNSNIKTPPTALVVFTGFLASSIPKVTSNFKNKSLSHFPHCLMLSNLSTEHRAPSNRLMYQTWTFPTGTGLPPQDINGSLQLQGDLPLSEAHSSQISKSISCRCSGKWAPAFNTSSVQPALSLRQDHRLHSLTTFMSPTESWAHAAPTPRTSQLPLTEAARVPTWALLLHV